MRGVSERQLMMVMLRADGLIPAGHPIRKIRRVVDEVLAVLDGEFIACTPRVAGRRASGSVFEIVGVDGVVLDAVRAGVLRTAQLRRLVQMILDMPIDAKGFDATTFTEEP